MARPEFEHLEDVARAAAKRLRVPGAVIGVLTDGEEEAAGFGVTSVRNPLPVDTRTLFQTGSITKTFVGTLALRLVDGGRLELDEPVRTYLPELRLADGDAAARVTMRHLLTHTAGWVGDYFADFGRGDDALERMVAALERLPQLTPVGEVWSYCNSGFYVAGRVIERVTGSPFEEAMRTLVFEPLGLESTFFFAEDVVTRRFAVGHFTDEEVTVAEPWALGRSAHAAGGIVSNVHDLLRYARFHLGAGDGVLERASLEQMRAPLRGADGVKEMALTWFIRRVGGVAVVGHSGETNGQIATFQLVPSDGFAVVVLTNASPAGDELAERVLDEALRTYAGADELPPPEIVLSQERLAQYAGRYTSAADDRELRIENGRLFEYVFPRGGFPDENSPPRPPPPPSRLAFYREDGVIVAGRTQRNDFLRDGDGRIAWYRAQGRLHRPA